MATLEPAARLLVIAGLVVLLFGFFLGIPLAVARSSSPAAPRALVGVHLEMLTSGTMLLALAAILQPTGLDGGVGVVGTAILMLGVGLLGVGGTLNWRQGVDDQFARRSAGWRCNAIAGPTALVGLVVLTIGVVGTW